MSFTSSRMIRGCLAVAAIGTLLGCGDSDDDKATSAASACAAIIGKATECKPELEAWAQSHYGSNTTIQIATQAECESNLASSGSAMPTQAQLDQITAMSCTDFANTYGPSIPVKQQGFDGDLLWGSAVTLSDDGT